MRRKTGITKTVQKSEKTRSVLTLTLTFEKRMTDN